MKNIVILGSNFAGYTAAMQLVKKLKGKRNEYKVIVVSPSHDFLYVPSLIWVPFGRRNIEDIRFDFRKIFKNNHIEFIEAPAESVDPEINTVYLPEGKTLTYEYLVVATGVKMNFGVVDGLKPEDNKIQNIVIPKLAMKTREAFEKLVKDPGPVVVGATQGASCMGAAYEYLFNMDKELRLRGVRKQVKLYWITPEPYLGNFGIDGMPGGEKMLKMFMKLYNIEWITDASIAKIEDNKITLKTGEELPYKMAMLMPPFEGADVMKASPKLVDAKGFVEVTGTYQHIKYENVFAAGLAVKVAPPFEIVNTPFGVPKTGYPSDVTGKIVAGNIIKLINGKTKLVSKEWGRIPALCVMDAGHKEIYLIANHLFKPRQFAVLLPNIFNDLGKVFLEKYFIWKNRNGYAWLP
ncbi:FAD/NAD(P)-binding oxidoreductase [Fulvivirga kasyanovii]|uniref:NAD(P)/FAD-dependent oxidoreductase n=1 Tax=Fulvivirga kasyanovii TaxID=396812 RepID=A0ABW9RTM2_9BACT|nr:FAD-dependent oxidoreductase [Fulvivirga kasyanovii]MTI27042.1 NAD(P)/FAD-dependent oxidoreductase [Fulvivirga kasyanovii]